MVEVVVVCEGQTEKRFVERILAPKLGERNVAARARIVATSKQGRGGALTGARVIRFFRNVLRQRRDTRVTSFFDLYGLPSDFPGQSGAGAGTDPAARAAAVEMALHREIVNATDCRADRFLPHIQPYEFEALLFSDVSRFAEEDPEWRAAADQLAGVREEFETPEHIDDGPETHPSARLAKVLPSGYEKALHGVEVAERIGLDRMRTECRHFGAWLTRLEGLGRAE